MKGQKKTPKQPSEKGQLLNNNDIIAPKQTSDRVTGEEIKYIVIDQFSNENTMTLSTHIAPQPMVTFLDRSNIPYTTQRYRKRKLEMEKEGITKRKYDRKKVPVCKQCGQDRIPPDHVQYFMNWFCRSTATQSFEDWKTEIMKKGYGKKPRK
ncbi:hypothetical protein DPMN_041979 [Dreissena polymorpha]|nr:hypothetical protein DPMN_071868 [Dreissena polymorpha]KAH3712358.1 hypothetical protein DPMN_072056 [Dreissena polymorpha]KAH3735448.1 hypothetical protein DPMN_041979 [Dreissena polymorpha]